MSKLDMSSCFTGRRRKPALGLCINIWAIMLLSACHSPAAFTDPPASKADQFMQTASKVKPSKLSVIVTNRSRLNTRDRARLRAIGARRYAELPVINASLRSIGSRRLNVLAAV